MGLDRISELTDSLLTQILSYLPTKDSVKTSVLSTRWESLWLSVPVLDLKVTDFPDEDYATFIDNFLELNQKSRLQKFKLKYDEYTYDDDRLSGWVCTAVNRGVQHVDGEGLDTDMCMREFMPQDIYYSNTLVSLKLVTLGIPNPDLAVSLPCLKKMHLEDVWYFDDPLIMEKVISGCPALEDLTLIRPIGFCDIDAMKVLRVRSQALKRLLLTFEHSVSCTDYSVEIDAPRLQYLCFNDNQSDVSVVKNLTSLLMIDLDTEFNVQFGSSPLKMEDRSKRDIIREFLTGISNVEHMMISQPTLEVLYQYSNLGRIPEFVNLYRLEAAFSSSMLQLLPVFLRSCPNLKRLILDFAVSAHPEQIKRSYVPPCLSLTLECVEIRKLILKEETGIKLVKYFLENAAVLKKLSLSFTDSSLTNQELDIYKNLLTSTNGSLKCQGFVY
ncbi:unnamed protein product [Thlaspi arvense]|uniref:FBD domain-containing protein n=1 Tax=Thlaspi arvense TaxID=13288 RepID=A0AAU9RN59_THLAR|nr:unnamed protein product [Thlaspi arvense]